MLEQSTLHRVRPTDQGDQRDLWLHAPQPGDVCLGSSDDLGEVSESLREQTPRLEAEHHKRMLRSELLGAERSDFCITRVPFEQDSPREPQLDAGIVRPRATGVQAGALDRLRSRPPAQE
jgi:hypothetical protein